mmetsp:Transcript_10063/g.29660  ORF Transcript_10063/g.29660 Transcript_10063/m.29660 type:complete len:232 (-) Transcript_10063:2226-2921(-)
MAPQSAWGYTAFTSELSVSKSGSASASACSDWSPPSSSSVARDASTRRPGTDATGASVAPDLAISSAMVSMTRVMSCCAASQRLKGSVSCAMRKDRSSSVRAIRSVTGAEKPRSTDGTTGSVTPSKVKVCLRSVSSTTVSGSASPEPSRLSSAKSTGMCSGPAPAPALALDCSSVMVKTPLAASWAQDTARVGVPACLYHSSNCVRSLPFASAMALRKSSQVTACPSWRSK